MKNKFQKLQAHLQTFKKQGLCLAFSGGIDSVLLMFLCKDMDIVAITLKSVLQDDDEIKKSKDICNLYKIKQKIIKYDPLQNELIRNNHKNRCYYCKKLILNKIKEYAKERLIIDGTNADDLKTYRPGIKALEEMGIYSPFTDFKITKSEIRDYAKYCGIKIYNKPSMPCFATRFPYNTNLSCELINTAKKSEKILKKAGFENCRFRIHGDIARIEISLCDMEKFIKYKKNILKELKKLNINYFTLDLDGIKSGSMDINGN